MFGFDEIQKFVEVDKEKLAIIEDLQSERVLTLRMPDFHKELMMGMDASDIVCEKMDYYEKMPSKFCPKCGREFYDDENFCPECLVTLKGISDKADIKAIETSPNITFNGKNDYPNILNQDCINIINDFNFNINDFNDVLFSIKSQAFKNLDNLIKDNSIVLDDLDILDKVVLFTKSFVSVEYKSYGETLGYFELNKIYIDDRQRNSLQITTMIHELTHFLMKEIFVGIICKLLDCSKNKHIESVVTYILNYSKLNELIDEYAAHSVEGRFTVFGYQDYSSFIALQGDLDVEHVEIAKTIGNTFSIHIKDLLEGFLDWDARDEIKTLFLDETIEQPKYEQLRFENCSKLSDEGLIKALWVILGEIESADENKIRDLELEF